MILRGEPSQRKRIRFTRERWRALCQRIGAKDNPAVRTIDGTYDDLICAYSGSNRHYHDWKHINEGLELIDRDEIKDLSENPNLLEMAWWWHDFICTAGNPNNERQSADMAHTVLVDFVIPPENKISIECHILATKHNFIPDNNDSRLIVDIDLLFLSAPLTVFDYNTANIRKEYFFVSDKDFIDGRAQFFKNFLRSRPSIYLTDYFKEKYEAQAQENIGRVLARAGI